MDHLKIKEITDLYEMALSKRKIAHQLNIDPEVLEQVIIDNKLEIKKRKWDTSSPIEIEFLKKAHQHNTSSRALARNVYGFSTEKITNFWAGLGLQNDITANVHQYNNNIFNTIDTESKAYWLGYIFGDGANQEKSLNFSVNENKYTHLQHLAEFMGDDPSRVKIKEGYAKYKIYSKQLFDNLTKLGHISPKSDAYFPQIVPELYPHFIRGYLDGKSSMSMTEKSREWKLTISGNILILQSIIDYTKCGLKMSKNSSGYYQIVINGNQKLLNFCNWLYKDATIYFDHRYEKYQSLLKQQNKKFK